MIFYFFHLNQLFNPNKAWLFEGSFSCFFLRGGGGGGGGGGGQFDPPSPPILHILRRTYPTSIKLSTIVKQSI